MVNSLFTALSGLKTHQDWLGVIGNNLANSNTPGFKSSRAVFSDLFSQTLRFGSQPGTTAGGRNPVQVGLGTQIADVSRNMNQGALTATGRPFDLAMNGNGWFVVSNGPDSFYTRVGTFGLDGSGTLVDQRTGFQVIGMNNQRIRLDTSSAFPPSATMQVDFAGNLPADVTGPLAQVQTTASGLMEGTSAQVLGGLAEPFDMTAGTFSMDIIVNGGAPVTLTMGPGTYQAIDVANAINALGAGVTATDVGGQVQLQTDKTGADTSLRILSGPTGFDLAAVVGLDGLPLTTGTEFVATGTSDLNLLSTNLNDYVSGDVIDLSGVDTDGTQISASFRYGIDGTTVNDLVTYVDGLYANATAAFDPATGQITLTANQTGPTGLSLAITEPSTPFKTNWAQHALTTTTVGTGPDTAVGSIEVYDPAGTAHPVTFTFERQADGSWNVIPSMDPAEGTVLSPTITGLTFNDNGSIATLPGVLDVSVMFNGQSASQQFTLDLGMPGMFQGITQFGGQSTLFAESQDGFGVGELTSIGVNAAGDIQGFYSNGQVNVLGELAVATFTNDNGLFQVGDNLFAESSNSGSRAVTKGQLGRAGEVVGGTIEGSNVEIAEEFVRLIEAQRGFQANARLVTTTDEVLAELVNLI